MQAAPPEPPHLLRLCDQLGCTGEDEVAPLPNQGDVNGCKFARELSLSEASSKKIDSGLGSDLFWDRDQARTLASSHV